MPSFSPSVTYLFFHSARQSWGNEKEGNKHKSEGERKTPFPVFLLIWTHPIYLIIFLIQTPGKMYLKRLHFLKLFPICYSLPIFTALAQTTNCPGRDLCWALALAHQSGAAALRPAGCPVFNTMPRCCQAQQDFFSSQKTYQRMVAVSHEQPQLEVQCLTAKSLVNPLSHAFFLQSIFLIS